MNTKNIVIPIYFFHTKYNGLRYPGNIKIQGLKQGANCQYFACQFLQYFGLELKDFRSDELWEERIFTKRVTKLNPLDLVFFNKTLSAYGAHIGVSIGQGKVIHLSKKIGYPTVWDLAEFSKHKEYRVFIGAKRVITPNSLLLD